MRLLRGHVQYLILKVVQLDIGCFGLAGHTQRSSINYEFVTQFNVSSAPCFAFTELVGLCEHYVQ